MRVTEVLSTLCQHCSVTKSDGRTYFSPHRAPRTLLLMHAARRITSFLSMHPNNISPGQIWPPTAFNRKSCVILYVAHCKEWARRILNGLRELDADVLPASAVFFFFAEYITQTVNLLIIPPNADWQLQSLAPLQMEEKLSLLIFRFIALVWFETLEGECALIYSPLLLSIPSLIGLF